MRLYPFLGEPSCIFGLFYELEGIELIPDVGLDVDAFLDVGDLSGYDLSSDDFLSLSLPSIFLLEVFKLSFGFGLSFMIDVAGFR